VAILEVNDLKTHFFTREGVVQAVDGISFSLEKGKTLGIVGESGCGKSVTALSIMGLIPKPPAKIVGGEVLFDGKDLTKLSEGEMQHIRGNEVAMIFQDPMTSLNPTLKIGTQITETILAHRDVSKQEARRRAVDLLKEVGIPRAAERLDDYPHRFSGGMRQRVMIAIAPSCSPRLLIADEPTTALDVTILGLDIALALGGAIFTETIFGLPGLGRSVIVAYERLDLPVIVGVVVFSTIVIILFNLIVDCMYAVLDPRIRLS